MDQMQGDPGAVGQAKATDTTTKVIKRVVTGVGGVIVVCLGAVALTAGGFGKASSTFEQRASYLQKTAERGAAIHDALVAQEAYVDKPRCMRAYEGTQVEGDAPSAGTGLSADEDAWKGQIKEVFVDSCFSGKPKQGSHSPSPSPSPSGSPTPSSSPIM